MICEKNQRIYLSVRVLPNAKRSGIAGIWNETALKIALRAPAVDGQANKALIAFLADFFGLKKKDVVIESGETSREKKVLLAQCDIQTIKARLDEVLHPK